MTNKEPDWEAVDAEVVEIQPDAAYKHSVGRAERKAVETGNLVPLVGALKAQDATDAEIVKKVNDVTVSGALRTAMSMPNAMFTAGDKVVTNAEAIGKVLMEKAISGDMSAIREVMNRTEGKVPNVTHNSSASVKVTGDAGSIGELMKRIDSNKG